MTVQERDYNEIAKELGKESKEVVTERELGFGYASSVDTDVAEKLIAEAKKKQKWLPRQRLSCREKESSACQKEASN